MRSREGAHIGHDISFVDMIGSFNVSEMRAFVCRAPALDEALGKHEHRAIVKTVELSISINGQTYGIDGPKFRLLSCVMDNVMRAMSKASDSQGSQMVSSICSDTVEARYAYCTQ